MFSSDVVKTVKDMFIILSSIFIKTEHKRLTDGTEAKRYIEKHDKEIIIIKIKQLN